MYGISSAIGAFGALSGLVFGKLVKVWMDNRSIYVVKMGLALNMIVLIYFSKIYKDKQFERPQRFRDQSTFLLKNLPKSNVKN